MVLFPIKHRGKILLTVFLEWALTNKALWTRQVFQKITDPKD